MNQLFDEFTMYLVPLRTVEDCTYKQSEPATVDQLEKLFGTELTAVDDALGAFARRFRTVKGADAHGLHYTLTGGDITAIYSISHAADCLLPASPDLSGAIKSRLLIAGVDVPREKIRDTVTSLLDSDISQHVPFATPEIIHANFTAARERGLIGRRALSELGISIDRIAVYTPHGYTFQEANGFGMGIANGL
jgi:hypothetical protein